MPSVEPESGTSPQVAADENAEAAADRTLLDEMLAMTVQQRLRENDRAIRTIIKLRAGFAAREPSNHDGT